MILMWEEEVACTVVERLPLVLKTSGATYKPSIIMPTGIHNAYWNMKFAPLFHISKDVTICNVPPIFRLMLLCSMEEEVIMLDL